MIKIFENPDFFRRFTWCRLIKILKVNIDDLSVIVYKNKKKEKCILPIEDSPAYKFLLGDEIAYLNYLKLEDEDHKHNKENFLILINCITNFNIKKFIIINEKFEIIDGQHRAAILKYNYKSISLPVLMAIF
jgi:hypothetical protein